MERDMRDPGTLGNALLLLWEKQKGKPLSAVAEEVDRGILGDLLIHPGFLNGRSHERINPGHAGRI